MDKKKILFLVDHKHRDLPSLSLVAFHLNNLGCEARLVALGKELKLVKEFDPGFIVIPKPSYNYRRLVEWKISGRKIIVIDSEGNHQDKILIMRILVAPDLYCFWNQEVKDQYKKVLSKHGTKLEVLGFLRGDFLHKKYQKIFPSREILLKKYGLNSENKVITFATSTQDSHFSTERVKAKRRRRNKSYSKTANYLDIVENMRSLKAITEESIRKLIIEHPNVSIVIKPHPNENVVYWNELISELDAKNIKLLVGEPINHLLRISDLHITHNVCTTTIESMMMGIPTAEIHTLDSQNLYKKEHLYMANYIAHHPDDINAIAWEVLDSIPLTNAKLYVRQNSDLTSYIKNYFFKFDGNRCIDYAIYLNEFMKENKKKNRIGWLLHHPRHVLPYFARVIWQNFKKLRQLKKKTQLETEVNNPSFNNDRDTYSLNGHLVDKEYGLFDNRMKLGDEQVWFKKFRDMEV